MKNTSNTIPSLNRIFYFNVRRLGKTLVVLPCILFPGIAEAGAAQAPAVESIITGFVVQEKKTCHFMFQHEFRRFFRLLKAFGIEIDWDIRICGRFRLAEMVSRLEMELERQERMGPVIRAELDVLKGAIGE